MWKSVNWLYKLRLCVDFSQCHVSNSNLRSAPTKTRKIIIDIVSHMRWFKRQVLFFGNPTRFFSGEAKTKKISTNWHQWTHWIRDATNSLFNRTRQMAHTVSVQQQQQQQQQRTGDQSHCDPSEHLYFRPSHLTNSKIVILLVESKRPKLLSPVASYELKM